MTSPENNIELLVLYKIGLQCGMIDTKALVDFADTVIAKEGNPDDLFIEVSLWGSDKNRLIDVLSDFVREHCKKVSGDYLFGAIRSNYLQKKINLEEVVRLLYRLKDELDLTDEEEAFIYSIDAQYYLAVDNVIGTIEGVEQDTLNFLATERSLSVKYIRT